MKRKVRKVRNFFGGAPPSDLVASYVKSPSFEQQTSEWLAVGSYLAPTNSFRTSCPNVDQASGPLAGACGVALRPAGQAS